MIAFNAHHPVRVGGRGYASVVLGMGPVAYWRGLLAGSLPDVTGDHDATVTGSVRAAAGPIARDSAESAEIFDSDGLIEVASSSDFDVTNVKTFAAWVRHVDAGSFGATFPHIVYRAQDSNNLFRILIGNVNSQNPTGVLVRYRVAGVTRDRFKGDVLQADQWNHLVVRVPDPTDVATWRVVVNGEESTLANGSFGDVAENNNLVLGGLNGGGKLGGRLAEAAIFNHDIGTPAAQTLYLAGLNGT